MDNKSSNVGFKTDAFTEALKKNEEMNKGGVMKNETASPAGIKNGVFITDAFNEALKIKEDRDKKDMLQKVHP